MVDGWDWIDAGERPAFRDGDVFVTASGKNSAKRIDGVWHWLTSEKKPDRPFYSDQGDELIAALIRMSKGGYVVSHFGKVVAA